MTELLDQGAAAIAAAVRKGKTKARDVAEAAIARVEARNKDLTAIVDFNPAGRRPEPPPSVPNAIGVKPAASAAAAPPEDPPGVSAMFAGLREGP